MYVTGDKGRGQTGVRGRVRQEDYLAQNSHT